MCSSSSASKANYVLAIKQERFVEQQAAKAEADEAQRQENIKTGLSSIDQQFSKFDPSFYDNISNTYYNDYAKPQLDQSQQNQYDKVRLGLARSGILQSSSSAKEFGDLSQTFAQANVDAQSRGLDVANQRKSDIESNRTSITNQLYASENPEVALQSAQRAVTSLSGPTALTPITDILNSAAQFASRDYVNNIYGTGNGSGFFSPYLGKPSNSSSGSARTIN